MRLKRLVAPGSEARREDRCEQVRRSQVLHYILQSSKGRGGKKKRRRGSWNGIRSTVLVLPIHLIVDEIYDAKNKQVAERVL